MLKNILVRVSEPERRDQVVDMAGVLLKVYERGIRILGLGM